MGFTIYSPTFSCLETRRRCSRFEFLQSIRINQRLPCWFVESLFVHAVELLANRSTRSPATVVHVRKLFPRSWKLGISLGGLYDEVLQIVSNSGCKSTVCLHKHLVKNYIYNAAIVTAVKQNKNYWNFVIQYTVVLWLTLWRHHILIIEIISKPLWCFGWRISVENLRFNSIINTVAFNKISLRPG